MRRFVRSSRYIFRNTFNFVWFRTFTFFTFITIQQANDLRGKVKTRGFGDLDLLHPLKPYFMILTSSVFFHCKIP